MVSTNDLLSFLNDLSHIDNPHTFSEFIANAVERERTNIALTSLSTLDNLKNIWNNAVKIVDPEKCSSYWSFVSLSLECLVSIKNCLAQNASEEDRLLSVTHQRSVRALLAKLVELSLVPNLLPYLQPPGTTATPTTSHLSEMQKYELLCLVTMVLIELCEDDTFHGLVVPQFLLPLLCALCQLTLTPLKKSADCYPRLLGERDTFEQHFIELTERLYQPMVIKQLMVIQGNKDNPVWLKRGVGKLLTSHLLRSGGLVATLQAVRDAANYVAPTTPSHMEAIARVIVGSKHHSCICPQILDLLDSSDVELSTMGVLCVKTLYSQDKPACESYILQPLTKPLTLDNSTEQDISQCLNRLHKCFAVPASDLWCLNSEILHPHIQILFRLHCKIYQSASFLKQTVEDLVWCFLTKCPDSSINDIFKCLLYQERISGAGVEWNDGFEFCFGDDGGMKTTPSQPDSENSLEQFGDCLMVLLENRDTDGCLGNKLFVALLKFATENDDADTIDAIEKKLLNMKLLSVLAGSPTVQKSLSENPEPVVKFLSSMIADFLSDANKDVEIISLVLVVLNVILNDCIFAKKCCWKTFSYLERPLVLLKGKTTDAALRSLAQEAYEAIVTRGVITSETVKSVNNASVKVDRSCEEALKEACDPLLPVRGHAIMQLGKLVASKDNQAKAKKDQILCIFQENLKHEDSFLYLSAIEGLALAAAEYPDSAIMILAEQFKQHSLPVETRLKVGEALVRVIRLLGELVPVYKAELFNAFFQGTRDDDWLMRASSLSNLGELCHSLGFRVAPIIAEVLECANSCVQFDPIVEVRRAAVLLITLLIKGLRSDMFTVLENAISNIYRTLKSLYTTDKDDIIRLHAQLGMEELRTGAMEFLFPTRKLEKPIFVLNSL